MTAPARLILDPALLIHGLDQLCAADPDVAAARARIGDPSLRTRDPGFVTLLDVILGQQLSTASAGAIRARVHALVQPLTPETYLAMPPELLLKAGLSRQKLAYSRDLALASLDGRVDFDRLHGHEDEDAIEHLISIKGIGRWTAEIYLLFSLGRCDVWPAEDLALQVGLQHLKRLDERPRGKVMRALGEAWRPWRGIGAYFLWHVYHHLTRRVAVPIEPVPGGTAPKPAQRKVAAKSPRKKAAKRKPAKKKRALAKPARRRKVKSKPAKPNRSATRARS